MGTKQNNDRFKKLRDNAEHMLEMEPLTLDGISGEEIRKLVHELRVHEIELEMQNDELIRAQEQLELSKRDYTDLFDFAPIGYLVFDGDGMIRKANLKVADMLRRNRSELSGAHLTDFIYRDSQDAFYLFRRDLKRSASSRTCELKLSTGAYMLLEGVFVGGTGESDELYRLALIDISKQKMMEEDRFRLREEILQLQKLEGLRSLAGGVAHDLNNFMQAIIGNAEIAVDMMDGGDPAYEFVRGILSSASNATHLAKQMLSYSGKDRVINEPVILNIEVKNNAALMRAAVNKKTELLINVDDDTPMITADSQQLQQMLMNLILNADEAIGGVPGKITLTTGKFHADRKYLDTAYLGSEYNEGDYVFVEVEDTGRGIRPAEKARLFDPFYSTKSGGRGLGLSMVLGIARSHDAALVVDSEPGSGTRFRVLFPTENVSGSIASTPAPPPAGALKGKVVLLVDDDPQVLFSTGKLLMHAGIDVVTAETGSEAIEKFKSSPEKFSLVIMDLLMPVLSGDEAALDIREAREDIGIIFVSGYHQKDLSKLLGGPGVTMELEKPFSKSKLLETIQLVLENKAT